MKNLAVFLLTFLPLIILGQDCDCESTFNWMKKTFEENDAGFQYIVDKKGEQSYSLHNRIYNEKISAIEDPVVCESALREWLMFFRKAHVELHYTGEVNSQENDPEEPVENLKEKEENNEPQNDLHTKYVNSTTPFIEQLTENTLYVRIPSFDGTQKPLIDSVVLANRTRILSTENLIIDIRNGTGGNDASFAELLPIIYTNPIRMPGVEFLSTPLNNQRMYQMATNTGIALEFGLNPTEEEMAEYKSDFDTLSKHLGSFVNLNSSNITVTEFDTIHPFPRNVGVMINQNNASTDEQFLLEAKQSKKVKLFGTTTMGALDVSNLNLTYSPCDNYVLVYALSKSLRIPDMIVDDIGIIPDYYIDKEVPESEWIIFVSKILNK